MKIVNKTIAVIGGVSTLAAALFFLRGALIEVPNSQDDFIEGLQLIGWWNSAGCMAAFVASLCAAYVFFKTT